MTHTTENSIIEILDRKKKGIDCTEEESAEIKRMAERYNHLT